MPDATQPVAAVLTDGNPVSKLTTKKLVKDFVLDFLTSLPTAGIVITVTDLQDKAALTAALFGVGSALTGALLRAAIRWAQSPD